MTTGMWVVLMLVAGFLGGMLAVMIDTQYIFRKNGVWDRAYESGKAGAMSLMELHLQIARIEGKREALAEITDMIKEQENAGK